MDEKKISSDTLNELNNNVNRIGTSLSNKINSLNTKVNKMSNNNGNRSLNTNNTINELNEITEQLSQPNIQPVNNVTEPVETFTALSFCSKLLWSIPIIVSIIQITLWGMQLYRKHILLLPVTMGTIWFVIILVDCCFH